MSEKPECVFFRSLPDEVDRLLQQVNAPPRLVAHLTLVYDVAVTLTDEIALAFPGLGLDEAAILFGAATHDIGKSLYRNELVGAGSEHEKAGEQLLKSLGIEPQLARFARTHAAWQTDSTVGLEDLLVSLADSCWKGKRNDALEHSISEQIAKRSGREIWDALIKLDEILAQVTAKADERLSWQARFPA